MDDEFLASMGYKQELHRDYSTLEVFGISFSIMGLLPSIASTISIGLTGGPVSVVWGWFISGFFLVSIGIGMSELASSLPTSGGLYFWSFHYAPKKVKIPLSFFIGITNSLALIGALCSITYGLAGQILACANLAHEDLVITDAMTYGVFAGCIILQTILTCISSAAVARLQSISIYVNCFLILLFFIALPIGTKKNVGSFNKASYIFGDFENFSDWPNGWSFFQFGLMPAVWTIGAFDSCVHMSEEAKDPSKAVPVGIIGSISVCWILGLFINIVICACMIPDIDRLFNSATGQPLAQIFLDSLGRKWAIAFMALISVGQFLMGSSVLVAISRQVWAFARDDGLPFSRFIKAVNKKVAAPINAICFSSLVSIIIGCLCLIGSTAANALFSLSVLGNYVAWVTPQLLRFLVKDANFIPGKFYLGPIWSPIVNWISIAFEIFIVILCCFPDYKSVTKETMNYSIVLNGGTWIIAFIYFYVYKRRVYNGPKSNLGDPEEEEVVEILDGLEAVTSGPAPPIKSDV
jgi:amino acid transporter